MILAKVIGTVTSTIKHRDYSDKKVLMIQPVDPDLKPVGKTLLAVDGVQAGIGDIVLLVDEGGSAKIVLEDQNLCAIRCTVAGIVDHIEKEQEIKK